MHRCLSLLLLAAMLSCCGCSIAATTATRVLGPCVGTPWEKGSVCYPFVIRDSATGVYTMYYSGGYTCEISDSVWDQWATGYATSTDGKTWSRPRDNYEPLLYAHKFYEDDIVDPEAESAIFDSIVASGPCVIKDGPAYKMWYNGWNGDSVHDSAGITTKINFRIGYATSPDGLNWTKQPGKAGAGSTLGLGKPGQPDSKGAGHPHVLKEGSAYRMWYEGFDGTRWTIMYATSTDGMNWTRRGTALSPGAKGSKDALGARNPVVFARKGQYELWYQGRGAAAPNYHVLRATSPDGVKWTKAAKEIVLHPESRLAGDEQILVDSVLVNPDSSCMAFFAKQVTASKDIIFGTPDSVRYSDLYVEEVNP